MDYKCPNCSAVLTFNKDKNEFICENCKSKKNIDYFNHNIKSINSEYIIPFKVTKEQAIKKYISLIKSRLLTPSIFKRKKIINNIYKAYLPCYLYDFLSNGIVEFKGNLINSFKSSSKRYKKIDTYKLIRDCNMELSNVPISCSKILDDELYLIDSYNYDKKEIFNSSYLEDTSVYNFDKPKENIILYVQDKTKDIFVNEVKNSVKKYKNIEIIDSTVNIKNTNMVTILLPIWILNIKYKGKNFMYLINGQNSKISGSVPMNYRRLILIWIILFILVFGVMFMLNLVIL